MSLRRLVPLALAAPLLALGASVSGATVGTAGALDPTFGSGGRVTFKVGGSGFGDAVAIQSDGKIVAGGGSNRHGGNFALARLLSDGSLDPSFGNNGKVLTDFAGGQDLVDAVAIQSDGKIVAVGYTFDGTSYVWALARYLSSGSLDSTFGTGGRVTTGFGFGYDFADAVAIQSDAKIVVAGEASNGSNNDFGLARYLANGSLDTTFGSGGKVMTDFGIGNDSANGVAIQPDGRIVAAGYALGASNYDFAVARYNADGSPDLTFGIGGKVLTDLGAGNDYGHAVALQTGGDIVVAGEGSNGTNSDFAVVRYLPVGTPDPLFGTGGMVRTDFAGGDDHGFGVGIQSDAKIVVDGGATVGSTTQFAVARYQTDGTLDSGYGSGGKVLTAFGGGGPSAYALALQSDDKAVAAGYAKGGFALARYLAS